jgi:hypothetical protein
LICQTFLKLDKNFALLIFCIFSPYQIEKNKSIEMTEVPLISITLDENENDGHDDDNSSRPSINDCHTDVEDLEGDEDRKNSLILGLKRNSNALTDVESMNDSGDETEDEPETKYPEVDLSEMLDQGCIDESSNMMGNNDKKLVAMHSVAKKPSLTAFNLGVECDQGGVTDLEDVDGSGDEVEDDEKVYSDDDKAIILEDSRGIDIHDSVTSRKKSDKHAPKVVEPLSPSTSSSSEDDKPKMRLKTHKHYTKKSQKCSDAKSDTENIFFSDDEKRRMRQKSSPVLETPDIEVMAFDGSDHDDATESKFPEINISFVEEEKPKKKKIYRTTPAPSPMLALPQNQDEGQTDVENLNSSDDDDDDDHSPATRPKSFIPIAIIKSDALTDVEDFGDASDDDCDLDEKPDIPLPSPVREFTVLVENKSGEPVKQTTPLPDNLLLGFHDLDHDKGLTDVEDFSDESGGDDDYDDMKKYEIDCIPELDGGFVESSDHSTAKRGSLATCATPEPLTDTEDIFVKRQDKSGGECRRRRTKSKHSQHKPKSNFLDTKFYDDSNAGGAHTDVEDLDVEDDDVLLKDKSIKQRRSLESASRRMSNDGKTDIEYISGDDTIDFLRFSPELNPNLNEYQLDMCAILTSCDNDGISSSSTLKLNLHEIRKISPTPEGHSGVTDVEELNCNSDNEDEIVSYSRAQTATPME